MVKDNEVYQRLPELIRDLLATTITRQDLFVYLKLWLLQIQPDIGDWVTCSCANIGGIKIFNDWRFLNLVRYDTTYTSVIMVIQGR